MIAKLQWLAEYAEFDVTINSVLGSSLRRPEDAFEITRRARDLGFTSTIGVLHDEKGQLRPLGVEQRSVYEKIRGLGGGLFTFAHLDAFQTNLMKGLPNDWHCRAGGRFLYICEDGLVHYVLNNADTLAFLWNNTNARTSPGNRLCEKSVRLFAPSRAYTRRRCSIRSGRIRVRPWLALSSAGSNAIPTGNLPFPCACSNGRSCATRIAAIGSVHWPCGF